MAFEGKLVSQNFDDKPITELLTKIESDKNHSGSSPNSTRILLLLT